jgi:hypothetical protein
MIVSGKWRLYYKPVVNYASGSLALAIAIDYSPKFITYAPRVILQIVVSLTAVINDRNMFLVQATGVFV